MYWTCAPRDWKIENQNKVIPWDWHTTLCNQAMLNYTYKYLPKVFKLFKVIEIKSSTAILLFSDKIIHNTFVQELK